MTLLKCAFLLCIMCGSEVCLAQHDSHPVKDRDFWNLQARLTTDEILQESTVLAPE